MNIKLYISIIILLFTSHNLLAQWGNGSPSEVNQTTYTSEVDPSKNTSSLFQSNTDLTPYRLIYENEGFLYAKEFDFTGTSSTPRHIRYLSSVATKLRKTYQESEGKYIIILDKYSDNAHQIVMDKIDQFGDPYLPYGPTVIECDNKNILDIQFIEGYGSNYLIILKLDSDNPETSLFQFQLRDKVYGAIVQTRKFETTDIGSSQIYAFPSEEGCYDICFAQNINENKSIIHYQRLSDCVDLTFGSQVELNHPIANTPQGLAFTVKKNEDKFYLCWEKEINGARECHAQILDHSGLPLFKAEGEIIFQENGSQFMDSKIIQAEAINETAYFSARKITANGNQTICLQKINHSAELEFNESGEEIMSLNHKASYPKSNWSVKWDGDQMIFVASQYNSASDLSKTALSILSTNLDGELQWGPNKCSLSNEIEAVSEIEISPLFDNQLIIKWECGTLDDGNNSHYIGLQNINRWGGMGPQTTGIEDEQVLNQLYTCHSNSFDIHIAYEKILIYNSAGNLVDCIIDQQKTISLDHYDTGIYFIQLIGKDNFCFKFPKL